MLKKIIVVDYNEGAGGEYMASFLSAHFGQDLVSNPQKQPDRLQKWLNTHSLVVPDWNDNFKNYLEKFFNECQRSEVENIAVPYHLYKWPGHVDVLKDALPAARFLRINCIGHEQHILQDFRYKIWNRKLTNADFLEIKFLLSHRSEQFKIQVLQKLKTNQLVYKDLFSNTEVVYGSLPSNDVEVMYADFFINFDNTPEAYEYMCTQLEITPNFSLLNLLIQRNKKNLQDLNKYLSTI